MILSGWSRFSTGLKIYGRLVVIVYYGVETDKMVKIELALSGKRRLDVYVWGTEMKFGKETKKYKFRKRKDFCGLYVGFVNAGSLFGEIHFMKKWMGVGYCSHEFQHFFIEWVTRTTRGLTNRNEEQLVLFYEGVIRRFWQKYYKSIGKS